MPSCAVKSCKNSRKNSNKSIGITFHMFPSVENAAKDLWLAAIRRSRNDPHWFPTKGTVVCSDHFVDDDLYITDKGFRRVTRSGYPKKDLTNSPDTINMAIDHTVLPSTSSATPIDPSDSPDNFVTVDENCSNKALPTKSFTRIDDTKLHDWNKVYLTTRSEKLRNNIMRQKKCLKRTKMKIKALQQIVKQLKLQNMYLKDILKNKKASLIS